MILVVDDEDIIRRTAKAMLERCGFTVVLAENGKEGVELFQVLAEKVAAVLLDMTMPVMDGEEAFSRLRAIRPDIRVILSSGYNEVEAVRRFTGKGLAGFIQKPYSSQPWEKRSNRFSNSLTYREDRAAGAAVGSTNWCPPGSVGWELAA